MWKDSIPLCCLICIPLLCGVNRFQFKQHKKTQRQDKDNVNICRGRGVAVVVFGGRNHPWTWTWTWTPTNTSPHTIPSPTLPRDTSLVSDQHKTPSISSLSSFSSAPSFSGSSLLPLLRHIIIKGYPLFNLTIHPLPSSLSYVYPSLADFYFGLWSTPA